MVTCPPAGRFTCMDDDSSNSQLTIFWNWVLRQTKQICSFVSWYVPNEKANTGYKTPKCQLKLIFLKLYWNTTHLQKIVGIQMHGNLTGSHCGSNTQTTEVRMPRPSPQTPCCYNYHPFPFSVSGCLRLKLHIWCTSYVCWTPTMCRALHGFPMDLNYLPWLYPSRLCVCGHS